MHFHFQLLIVYKFSPTNELQNMQNHYKMQQLAKGVWEHDNHVDVFNPLNTTLTSLLRTHKQCFYTSQFTYF